MIWEQEAESIIDERHGNYYPCPKSTAEESVG